MPLTFTKEGLLSEKEIHLDNTEHTLISKSVYTYRKKLMISAVDRTFEGGDETKVLEKKTFWSYSDDQKANIISEREEFVGDPTCNRESTMLYGDYNILLESTRKKGSAVITERNELHSNLGNRVIKCKKIIENGILKEKVGYEYTDPKNPYCVTSEKRYFAIGNGRLDQSSSYVETIYAYNSNKFTHSFVSKEQKGIKDADGLSIGSLKETFDYDHWGRVVSTIDPRNVISTFRYDKLGRVVEEKISAKTGKPITMQTYYNDRSGFITTTDANAQKKRIKYTPPGDIQQICLATANEPAAGDVILQNYYYNSVGELTEVISYDGNGTANANVRKTERYTYDSLGRIRSRAILQVGYEETYHYNEVFTDPADGKKYFRKQKIIKGDRFAPTMTSELYEDQRGQTRKEFLSGVRIATYEYDNMGNQIRKIDAQNKVERWEYDYAGRVVKSIRTDTGQDRVIRQEYDALGNKRFSWDEAGKKTEFQYDSAGRLVQTIAPFDHRNQKVKYYYDGAGNVLWEKKALQNGWQEIQYLYDAVGHLTDTYQYLSETNWIRTRYQSDATGNLLETRTGCTPADAVGKLTKYTYNRFGKMLTMTDALGHTESYQYDKTGRLLAKTDRNRSRTVYQHDAVERLIKETVSCKTADGAMSSEREYGYSKTGQKIRAVSRQTLEGNTKVSLEIRYYYDNRGQLIRQEDPGNTVNTYTYDKSGNRQSFRLVRSGQEKPEINLYYLYDDLYHLKQVRKDGAGGTLLAEYEYDIRGNRKVQRYPKAGLETNYSYNDGNRVISLETKRRGVVLTAWVYDYDVDGNLLLKTDKARSPAAVISYCYDRLGRLIEENNSNWKRTLYSYDASSNRSKMMVEGKSKDELVSVTNYEYDRDNRLGKETRKQGKITETYWYRYDDNGNETFRIWERTAPTPDYPGTVRLSSSWKTETPTVYEWRHYDGFNQLIHINQDEREITYQYRGDSLRHRSEVRNLTERGSKTNVYHWDGSDIVGELTEDKKVKNYLRGTHLLAHETDGVVYYYIHDEHGDVIQLRTENGVCKASYEYDGFGNERKPGGEDENPFRYCGEYFDLSSGTYYLRARYYNPNNARFLTQDSARGIMRRLPNDMEVPDPLSLNLYTYAHNNPINNIDPTGLWSIPTWAKYVVGAVIITGLAVATVSTGGAAAVIAGAALSGAIAGGASGLVIGAGTAAVQHRIETGRWKGAGKAAYEGGADGFMWGSIIGGATGATSAGMNIATGGTQIVGQAHGSTLHKLSSNMQAGKMAASGNYLQIGLNRSLNTMGLKGGGLRPDVIGIGKNGTGKLVEVVSLYQKQSAVVNKTTKMVTQNPNTTGKVIKWVGNVGKAIKEVKKIFR